MVAINDAAEALDRMFILTETFNLYVRDHPAIASDPQLSEGASFLAGVMLGFYSRLGGSIQDIHE